VARQLNQSLDINITAENSEAREVQQTGAFRNFELNQRNPTFRSFSEGTGGTNFPPNLSARTVGSDIEMVFTSNPSTPRTSDSVVPANLMSEYCEWLRERHRVILQTRIQFPQSRQISKPSPITTKLHGGLL
jgi:hypothetical protein